MADEIEIRPEEKILVIEPVRAPRAGWFSGYQPENDVEPLAALPADDGEWAW